VYEEYGGWVSDLFRLINPGVGDALLETVREVSLTIVFAALYVAAVIALAPISFSVFQVRAADALLPLGILFGWPIILGVSVGAVVANFFGGLGTIDVVGGGLANFIATFLAWKIGCLRVKGSWIYATAAEILTVSLIVGTYLSYLFNMPLKAGLFGVLLGSLIAIGILGYTLLEAFSRPSVVKILRSRGIKLYLRDQD